MSVHRKVVLVTMYYLCQFIFAATNNEGFKAAELGAGLSTDKFGKTKPNMTKMAIVKGPKRVNCCEAKLETKNEDYNNITFSFTLANSVTFDKAKISIWMGRNTTSSSPDIVKLIDHPCSHFLFSPILKQYFNASPQCSAKKGKYKFSLNIRALSHELFGLKFFYGKYWAKSCLLGKNCNVICVTTEFTMEDPKAPK